ncbi:single-stranded DNA-binding protein (plasmid) [Borreliella burgdorferi]|uniref:2.9-5 36K minus strand ORF n=2 Tax=Borreliella burgdorferi TaxID=139 RepID=Q9RZY8_BORBU|nr:ERF family protein [Borreliella burgdorferi]AAF07725.1 2.9-5 36K; minus strand ORF [Borreliella burgdorferi B31]ARS31005.1 single-stranded DNA-binding protein [Borreliella burgdorferi]ARS32263.1 single-stranded DNA-binding protein [Borreliella burgdorferi]ARS32747.1 single-stranded DNA-binding protein [Borreliella burgdorferi]MCR8876525.1 ERF family protein [Borreliella burgdorferi]
MENLSNNNNQEIQNNIQAEIDFLNDMDTLRMNLPLIDKSLKGYGYKYQDFNVIVEVIQNVIKNHNLKLGFWQFPTFVYGKNGEVPVVRTTFYSKSTGYKESLDTLIHTDKLQWNGENGSKNLNTMPQLVGAAITYFKRYALVAYLDIKSEFDTDAAPIYNNHENENSMSNKQVSVNQKQEQKKDINQEKNQLNTFNKNLKSGKAYCYEIFRDALFNIKNWVNEGEEKNNINALIRALCTDNDDALEDLFEKNAELKSIEYWVNFLKKYFNKTNRFDDLNKLKVFMSDNRDVYKTKVLKFFCMLKKERQFNYIFAA